MTEIDDGEPDTLIRADPGGEVVAVDLPRSRSGGGRARGERPTGAPVESVLRSTVPGAGR